MNTVKSMTGVKISKKQGKDTIKEKPSAYKIS